jgi:hypothetical protein
MTKRSLPFRTIYFSLDVCKHIFQHPTHGLVFVRDAMRCSEAERYGLSPLLLYALSVPDTAIRRMTFAALNQPHAIYATLHRLWTQEEESFRGRPDAVLLSRQVAAASPTLADRLAPDGVELIVADKGDKVSGAALRTAQQDAMSLGLLYSGRIDSLDRLEEAAADRHRFDLKEHIGNVRQRQEQWAALPCRPVSVPSSGDEMDWVPGPWLGSWGKNLPPVSQPRYFHDNDREMWLLTGSVSDSLQNDSEEDDESDEEQGWEGDDEDSTVVALAKDMVTCWPNSVAEIARSIGSTTRDLKWFLDGKASLDKRALSELLSVLGIEWLEEGYYQASGPCLLVAKNLYAAHRIYDQLSHGGDLSFSYEVVPESGQTDPSWRYLLFQGCGEPPSIMMFERGSKAAANLNDTFFINFEGVWRVPSKLYRDVVATGAHASHSPLINRREMRTFEQRHGRFISDAVHDRAE